MTKIVVAQFPLGIARMRNDVSKMKTGDPIMDVTHRSSDPVKERFEVVMRWFISSSIYTFNLSLSLSLCTM